jgi:hypothetical protein
MHATPRIMYGNIEVGESGVPLRVEEDVVWFNIAAGN